ncbi:hypothetical protein WJU23_15310 [Prosthecobacter sp. SYSU 5D2]|uniref:hypothetical protein n=1 Tax=Prosthecobacter sp. SYSU 5D2 TaxID=3134134 RepID=UPI0031FEE80D
MKLLPLCLLLALTFSSASARSLKVDPVTGDDTQDGVAAAVKTIARAVSLAQPGDTVDLAPATYYESVNLGSKHGLPGQPITVDGHGAVIDGSDPIIAAEWEALGGGLFRKTGVMPGTNRSYLGRWYFLWNGRMNRMGRTSKGPSATFKKVDELLADEWTYVEAEDAFYLKLPEGQKLDEASIRCPIRANGVSLSRTGAHLVIRNLTCTHVYNDGFNVHGDQVDTVFENIAAIDCGDDGFSAHETGECRIDGFTSMGNSTGLCDIGSSVTHYKNVFISGCHGHDIFFIGDTAHSMENVLVESSAASAVTIGQGTLRPELAPCVVTFKNVLCRRAPGLPGALKVNANSQLDVQQCTFIGLQTQVLGTGRLGLTESVICDVDSPLPGADAAGLEKLRR